MPSDLAAMALSVPDPSVLSPGSLLPTPVVPLLDIGVIPLGELLMPSDLAAMALPVQALSPLYVAIVSFSCFRRFRGMLQLNRKDVAQVDLGDVLPMFQPVFKDFVASTV